MSETYLNDEMFLDGLLDELVAIEPKPAWGDVLHRARRTSRRYAAAAVGVATLVLAPSAWAVQHVLAASGPVPVPPAYQPGDKVWTQTPPITPVTTTITCNTINDAATLLATLEQQGSPVNDVECSSVATPSSSLPSAPNPYQPGDKVLTNTSLIPTVP
jgi:hypothetical protein